MMFQYYFHLSIDYHLMNVARVDTLMAAMRDVYHLRIVCKKCNLINDRISNSKTAY